MEARIAIEPRDSVSHLSHGGSAILGGRVEILTSAVEEVGGKVTKPEEANALIWLDPKDSSRLISLLNANPDIKWVQLPWAGVEHFLNADVFNHPIVFTSAKSAYGEQVGEHALTLILACLRHLVEQTRTSEWREIPPESLFRKRITILGAGGIANTLIALLKPFDCEVTVLRKTTEPVKNVNKTLSIERLHEVLPHTDILVIALALTPETDKIIGTEELKLMNNNSIVINVARGSHIDTDSLVDAIKNKQIGAAGLDVTDPEPLPSDHPLWAFNNVLITSHSGDSPPFVTEALAKRVAVNVGHFINDEQLEAVVDPKLGY